jgi:hypothetical protein
VTQQQDGASQYGQQGTVIYKRNHFRIYMFDVTILEAGK